MNVELAKLGNLLYVHCPRLYRPVYRAYKALSDRAERQMMRQFIGSGMVVADVGANIGIYSRYFADLVGERGAVYAFEPEPRNFAALQDATRESKAIRAVNAAVGAESGTLKLYVSDDLNVDHHTYDDGEGRRTIEVPVIRLDAFFAPGTQVDFIKMDIQGYEVQALRGAERVLRENANIKLLVEYWPYGIRHAGCEAGQLIAFLRDLGFTLAPLPGGPGPEIVGTGINDYTNLYAYRA